MTHLIRQAKVHRKTKETDILLELNIDGRGDYQIDTPVPFLNHMMESFAKHGLFDLKIKAKGDIEVDLHHTVEDVGIVLGEAFTQALGDKSGMVRYGSFTLPMDEVLSTVAVDFCGRPCLVYQAEVPRGRIGDFDVELVPEWFQGFTNAAQVNLHAKVWYGRNRHHMVESLFKALARAVDLATQIDPRRQGVPSTKGSL
ncbi:MAG: imidazoleglycerol-phosphate dehydratase HisB [Deltaproteobacteria bacterium]|nr:imidazoleglycerol-phosphate dehydratase HisB [Deltaproteobacteria bacterium]